MDKEKTSLMIEYLRVLADLKRSDVFCTNEIKSTFARVEKELSQ